MNKVLRIALHKFEIGSEYSFRDHKWRYVLRARLTPMEYIVCCLVGVTFEGQDVDYKNMISLAQKGISMRFYVLANPTYNVFLLTGLKP